MIKAVGQHSEITNRHNRTITNPATDTHTTASPSSPAATPNDSHGDTETRRTPSNPPQRGFSFLRVSVPPCETSSNKPRDHA